MRKVWMILLLCLLISVASAEEAGWESVPEVLRPGKLVQLTYTLPEYGFASISVIGQDGEVVQVLKERAATRRIYWDGDGLAPGDYLLRLTCGDTVADRAVTIGPAAPAVTVLEADERMQEGWSAEAECSMPGTLTMTLATGETILTMPVQGGTVQLQWNGTVDGA